MSICKINQKLEKCYQYIVIIKLPVCYVAKCQTSVLSIILWIVYYNSRSFVS